MSHLHTTRNPQPENWRYHIHGPLARDQGPSRVAMPVAILLIGFMMLLVACNTIGS